MRSLTCASAGASSTFPFISSLSSHVATNTTILPSLLLSPHHLQSSSRHVNAHFHSHSSSNAELGAHPSFFDIKNNSLLLSAHAKEGVTHAIQNSWSKTTLRRYTGAIQQYIDFCIVEGFPDSLRFPADEFVLCAFAASSAGKHAGSTPRACLSAIKAWHIAHNMEWRGSLHLRYVLNGVSNLSPGTSRRPPRPPINSKMLAELIALLDITSPLDAAVAACAVVAFWGQCRLGELLPPTSASSPCAFLPLPSNLKDMARNHPLSYTLHLPRTKTHHHGEDVVLVPQCDPIVIDPIFLINNHLLVNPVPLDYPIFSFSSPSGLSVLTKPLFL